MKLNGTLFIPSRDERFKVKCKIDYLSPNSSKEYKYIDFVINEIDRDALLYLNNKNKGELNYFDVSIGNETWVLAESNIHSIHENRLIIRAGRVILSEG